MTEFTPLASLFGGALIGAVAVAMLYLNGRIAGVSGITAGLLPPGVADQWLNRFGFVLGIVIAPVLFVKVKGIDAFPSIEMSLIGLGIAGLLVGFGSVLGNGCTSGHGVCGISRLSMRSIVATAVFMLVAIVVLSIRRHLL